MANLDQDGHAQQEGISPVFCSVYTLTYSVLLQRWYLFVNLYERGGGGGGKIKNKNEQD